MSQNKKQIDLKALGAIYNALRLNNNYSRKLAILMLENLRKKDNILYERLLRNQLDASCWIPIINVNSLNTPYIEFLFKSDFSDQSPFDQLDGYSPSHLVYAKSILDAIKESLAHQ